MIALALLFPLHRWSGATVRSLFPDLVTYEGRLGAQFLPVFIDMQAIVVSTDEEFLQALHRRIQRSVEGQAKADERVSVEPVRSYAEFDRFIDSMLARIAPQQLVILLDEYELIGRKVREGKISRDTYRYLNSLLERAGSVHLVFAGSQPLEADPDSAILVGKSAYRETRYRYRMDLFRLYVQSEHNVWNVLNEVRANRG